MLYCYYFFGECQTKQGLLSKTLKLHIKKTVRGAAKQATTSWKEGYVFIRSCSGAAVYQQGSYLVCQFLFTRQAFRELEPINPTVNQKHQRQQLYPEETKNKMYTVTLPWDSLSVLPLRAAHRTTYSLERNVLKIHYKPEFKGCSFAKKT